MHGEREREAHLSVAICSFAMLVRSSWLVAALRLVRGVAAAELPPFALMPSVGVLVPVAVDASGAPLFFAACFAAFSASRFCFDADGGIVLVGSR